jgi:hypothetical protein
MERQNRPAVRVRSAAKPSGGPDAKKGSPMFSALDYSLWIFAATLDLAVTILLTLRRLHFRLPWFYRLMLFKVIVRDAGMALILTWCSTEVYFWAYWLTAAISAGLHVPVISELFLFDSRSSKRALLVILVVVGIMTVASPALAVDPINSAVRSLERCVWVTIAGLFFWSLNDRPAFTTHVELGIAIGLAIHSFVALLRSSIAGMLGPHFAVSNHALVPAAYLLTCTIWTYVLWNHRNYSQLYPNILLLRKLGERL